MRRRGWIGGLGVVFGLVGSCVPGPASMDTEGDSETDVCPLGTENCPCTEGRGCDADLICASNRCVSRDSDASTSVGDPSGPGMTTTSDETSTSVNTSEDSSTTGPEPTACDPANGVANPACTDPDAAYCDPSGTCVGCSEITCSDVAASTPACDASSGQCVECTPDASELCGGTSPVCDPETLTCVGCSDHSQCDSGACEFETGACFASVLYVDRSASCAGGEGTLEAPFCEIADAAAIVPSNTPTVIRVEGSPNAYTKQVQVPSQRRVAIVRDGDDDLVKLEVQTFDSLVVGVGTRVYLHNIQITKGGTTRGIVCSNAWLWMDRSQIFDRNGLAIDAVGCTLRLRQTHLYDNRQGAVRLNGGQLTLENSFVVSNGGAFSDISGLVLSNNADLDVLYSTIVNNDGEIVADSLHCTNAGTVALRNAVLFGKSAGTSVSCPDATATTSVVDAPSLAGEGNLQFDSVDSKWFVSPGSGNFGVVTEVPFKSTAVWRSGDPSVDYDGDPRPAVERATDYAGADRPK